MAFSLTNMCSLILLYFRLFKRRFLAIIGHGKPKSTESSLLPVDVRSTNGNSGVLSSRTYDKEGTESWEDWSKDAKQELTSVTVVDQQAVIEERKIDNLFASMAPVHQPKVAPPPSVPVPPQRRGEMGALPRQAAYPIHQDVLGPVSSASFNSRFAISDSFSMKVGRACLCMCVCVRCMMHNYICTRGEIMHIPALMGTRK